MDNNLLERVESEVGSTLELILVDSDMNIAWSHSWDLSPMPMWRMSVGVAITPPFF